MQWTPSLLLRRAASLTGAHSLSRCSIRTGGQPLDMSPHMTRYLHGAEELGMKACLFRGQQDVSSIDM